MYIYGLRDRKRAKYNFIFTDASDDSAKRTFDTACNQPNTIMGMYPTDFELFNLGELDENSGVITGPQYYLETGRRTNDGGNKVLFKTESTENDTE